MKQKQNQREISRCYLSGFEDGGMGTPIRKCRQLLTSEIGKGMDYFLEPLEGTQSCHHLNFSPVKPILYFLPQGHNNVISFLKAAKPMWICYHNRRNLNTILCYFAQICYFTTLI